MTDQETYEQFVALMIYKAINELWLSDLWDGEKYDVGRESAAGLRILTSFVERYLQKNPEQIIESNRVLISQRMGVSPDAIPHSDETLLRIGLGEHFSEAGKIMRGLMK